MPKETDVSVKAALERAQKLKHDEEMSRQHSTHENDTRDDERPKMPPLVINEERLIAGELAAREQLMIERAKDAERHHEMSKTHAIEREAQIAADTYGTKEANPIIAAERANRQDVLLENIRLKQYHKDAAAYLEQLLRSTHTKHYDDGPWQPMTSDLMGMLTQLDNMLTAWNEVPQNIPPSDTVKHPAHYGGKNDPYETIKVQEHKLSHFEFIGAMKFLIAKYLDRAGNKLGVAPHEDFAKAAFYANYLARYTEPKGELHGQAKEDTANG